MHVNSMSLWSPVGGIVLYHGVILDRNAYSAIDNRNVSACYKQHSYGNIRIDLVSNLFWATLLIRVMGTATHCNN